jgi:hypothetical protein
MSAMLRKRNPQLANFLDSQLLKNCSPQESWYESLIRYRHQIVHRTLFLLSQSMEGSFLPDDPYILDLQGMFYDIKKNEMVVPNYIEKREIKDYTLYLFEKVFMVIDISYSHLK